MWIDNRSQPILLSGSFVLQPVLGFELVRQLALAQVVEPGCLSLVCWDLPRTCYESSSPQVNILVLVLPELHPVLQSTSTTGAAAMLTRRHAANL